MESRGNPNNMVKGPGPEYVKGPSASMIGNNFWGVRQVSDYPSGSGSSSGGGAPILTPKNAQNVNWPDEHELAPSVAPSHPPSTIKPNQSVSVVNGHQQQGVTPNVSPRARLIQQQQEGTIETFYFQEIIPHDIEIMPASQQVFPTRINSTMTPPQ